jgi:hypothetical protein
MNACNARTVRNAMLNLFATAMLTGLLASLTGCAAMAPLVAWPLASALGQPPKNQADQSAQQKAIAQVQAMDLTDWKRALCVMRPSCKARLDAEDLANQEANERAYWKSRGMTDEQINTWEANNRAALMRSMPQLTTAQESR